MAPTPTALIGLDGHHPSREAAGSPQFVAGRRFISMRSPRADQGALAGAVAALYAETRRWNSMWYAPSTTTAPISATNML